MNHFAMQNSDSRQTVQHSFHKILEKYGENGIYAVEVSLLDGTKFKLLLSDLYIYLASHVYVPGFTAASEDTAQGRRAYYKPDRYYYYNQPKEKKVALGYNFLDTLLREIREFKNSRHFKKEYEFPTKKEIYSYIVKNYYHNKVIYKKWNKTSYKFTDDFIIVDRAIVSFRGEDDYCDYDTSIEAKVPVMEYEDWFCFNSGCVVSIKPYTDGLIDARVIKDKDFMEILEEICPNDAVVQP